MKDTAKHSDEVWTIRAGTCRLAGSRNLQRGQKCEDVVYIREMPDFLFYGLADGQTGKQFGAEGGLACLEEAADYIQQWGIDAISQYPFPDEIPGLLMRRLRNRLTALARECRCRFSDCASTLLAIAADPVTGQYVLIHLGDGCAIGVREEDSLVMISGPEHGASPHHTWLTTTDNAVFHFHLTFGTLAEKKRMLLLSDGADCLCRGKNIMRRARERILKGSQQELLDYVRNSGPVDDASCIILDLPQTCDP